MCRPCGEKAQTRDIDCCLLYFKQIILSCEFTKKNSKAEISILSGKLNLSLLLYIFF